MREEAQRERPAVQTASFKNIYYNQTIAATEMRMAEHEDRVRLLEARIQTLTEDNDDLRRDNALVERHNAENDYWQNNQEHLIEANKHLSDRNEFLFARVEALEKQLVEATAANADHRPVVGKQKEEATADGNMVRQDQIQHFFRRYPRYKGGNKTKKQ